MSRYDIAVGKVNKVVEDIKSISYFDSDVRVLLNTSMSNYITAFFRSDNSLYYAVIMSNMGNARGALWKMALSDNKGYDSYGEACKNFRDTLPEEFQRIMILDIK